MYFQILKNSRGVCSIYQTCHITATKDNLVCSAVSPFYIIHLFGGYAKEAQNTQYPTITHLLRVDGDSEVLFLIADDKKRVTPGPFRSRTHLSNHLNTCLRFLLHCSEN